MDELFPIILFFCNKNSPSFRRLTGLQPNAINTTSKVAENRTQADFGIKVDFMVIAGLSYF
jgi:hypothetical protein